MIAAGYDGTVIHYDGWNWEEMTSPTTDRIVDLWGGGADAVFALTDRSEVFRFDGMSRMSYGETPGGGSLDLWGTERELLAGGQAATVVRREW